MHAAYMGYLSVVQLLVKSGAKIDAASKDGMTALIIAATEKRGTVVKFLANKGANVKLQDEDGRTPIILLINASDEDEALDAIKVLVKKGCNLNARDKNLRRALDYAEHANQRKIYDYLLRSGAKLGSE